MIDEFERRRANFAREAGKRDLSSINLAQMIGGTASHWANLLTGARPILTEVARDLEEILDLPAMSLDADLPSAKVISFVIARRRELTERVQPKTTERKMHFSRN